MTKKEFLAISLPYGLKVKFITDRIQFYSATKFEAEFDTKIEVIKSIPILHPLSDLTNEIFVNGYSFIPIDWFKDKSETMLFEDSHLREIILKKYDYPLLSCSYRTIRKLVEWHFDIAGLIEKGDAIDVNSLHENPYK